MIINSSFKPAWWLKNPHLQTLWGALNRRQHPIELQRERIELPDGDFVDLDWVKAFRKYIDSPIVIVLHGLGGSIKSHYATPILQAVTQQGWRGVFMHFRGASGELNRLPRFYHSGDTADVNYVINLILEREPHATICCIGYSLGGNVLLKWMGETKLQNPLKAAVAISVPFELHKVATRLQHGFSRVYQRRLLEELHIIYKEKFEIHSCEIDIKNILQCKSFWEFDNVVTAPLHGFKNAADYYQLASSKTFLKHIRVPTLILHAADDPFMTSDIVPSAEDLSDDIILELSDAGGHVGFVSGNIPGKAEYWAEKRIVAYLDQMLDNV
jgi:uncharacterized protein